MALKYSARMVEISANPTGTCEPDVVGASVGAMGGVGARVGDGVGALVGTGVVGAGVGKTRDE